MFLKNFIKNKKLCAKLMKLKLFKLFLRKSDFIKSDKIIKNPIYFGFFIKNILKKVL